MQPWSGGIVTAGGRLDGQTNVDRLRPAWGLSLEQNLAPRRLALYATTGKSNRCIPLSEVNSFPRPARLLGPLFLLACFSELARDMSFEELRGHEGGIMIRGGRLEQLRLAFFAHKRSGPTGSGYFEAVPIRPVPGPRQISRRRWHRMSETSRWWNAPSGWSCRRLGGSARR